MRISKALGQGNWWNVDWAPTAAEWQALWMLAAFIAAFFAAIGAYAQLAQLRTGNKAALEAVKASTRPYLDVRFEFRPGIPGNPDMGSQPGDTYVVIENHGRSAAKRVRLRVLTEFRRTKESEKLERVQEELKWLNERFSGDYVFQHIAPGTKFEYKYCDTYELMDLTNGLPHRYVIEGSYFHEPYPDQIVETFDLDAFPWRMSARRMDPLEVIAKQTRRTNKETEKHQKLVARVLRKLLQD